MKPLIVLIVVFTLTLFGIKIFQGRWDLIFSGSLAMSMMLVLTAIGHMKFTRGMVMMMPSFLPYKKTLVYATGIFEIVAAVGLLIDSYRHLTAIALIIFFILILPANIYGAIRKVNIEKGSYNGPGPGYLWFRIPMQLFFIGWVWYFCL